MKSKNKNRDVLTPEESWKTIGENLSFAAAEAYKLLRTNLEFSLPAGDGCQVIGVTSALKGEGKSTTSINIAYAMAQTGKKVVLIEADLRLSTIARRLKLRSKPGLTNLLVGQCSGNDVLQKSGLNPNLWVVTAGSTPPNPAELLGSAHFTMTIDAMAKVFDVIIVDLPPITAVSDALVVSKSLSGVILVVRQNFCNRAAAEEAVRQLRFVDAKILGFVMTGANTQSKNYKRYGYYKQKEASGTGT